MGSSKMVFKRFLKDSRGIGLIVVLMVIALMSAVAVAFHGVASNNISTVRSFKDSQSGFYAAQSALVLRARDIRLGLSGFEPLEGTAPSANLPCEGSNLGTGKLACLDYPFVGYDVVSYVLDDPNNPVAITIPQGEEFQGMSALEYRYTVYSRAKNSRTVSDVSSFQLKFRSRTIPAYQFAALYDKNLEISPNHAFTIFGPIHANGDIFLNPGTSKTLSIDGQVTATGKIYRGARFADTCAAGTIQVKDPGSYRVVGDGSCLARSNLTENYLASWNGMIKPNINKIILPQTNIFNANNTGYYYAHSDLKLALKIKDDGTVDTVTYPTGVVVLSDDDTEDATASVALNSCTGNAAFLTNNKPIKYSEMFNAREDKEIQLLDIDMQSLLECLRTTNWFTSSKLLTDDSDGGMVFFFTVLGPDSNNKNNYGIRIKNAAELKPSGSTTTFESVTMVTDQALYVQGDFNSINKKPVSLLSDSFNVLSADFDDATDPEDRIASANITINAALVSGTDDSRSVNGLSNQIDSGGLTVFPRFHEDWTDRVFNFVGSMVSLGPPKKVLGLVKVGMPYYLPPIRAWRHDTSFNNPANLPPLSLQFSYLKEQLFLTYFN